ncbi:32159_t:CDS:2 [Racocetra persica]|uniref:32159_t:CDS:1 n=1 Tax=Racocetra persica TaxID=160502 RepID=A0ACA9KP20_9GLOM|nr:32159_t:CDS:2 [Racocetra persica]
MAANDPKLITLALLHHKPRLRFTTLFLDNFEVSWEKETCRARARNPNLDPYMLARRCFVGFNKDFWNAHLMLGEDSTELIWVSRPLTKQELEDEDPDKAALAIATNPCALKLLAEFLKLGGKEVPKKRENRIKIVEWLRYYGVIAELEGREMIVTRDWSESQIKKAKLFFHPYVVAMRNMHSIEAPIHIKVEASIAEYTAIKIGAPRTKLILELESYVKALMLNDLPPHDPRDVFVLNVGFTVQFDEDKPWTSCFPTHKASDYATLRLSLKRISIPAEARYYDIKPLKFDPELMHAVYLENNNVRERKALTSLMQIVDSYDPGKNPYTVETFLKQQGLTKLSKLMKTIGSHYAREKDVHQLQGGHHKSDGFCGGGNYDIPEYLMDVYAKYMLNMQVENAGYLQTMMWSGGPPTFFFNSIHNAAYSLTALTIKPGTPMLMGGDDSAINDYVVPRDKHKVKKYFKLIATTDYGHFPEFCGWKLTPFRAIKSPKKQNMPTSWATGCTKYGADVPTVNQPHVHQPKGLFATG